MTEPDGIIDDKFIEFKTHTITGRFKSQEIAFKDLLKLRGLKATLIILDDIPPMIGEDLLKDLGFSDFDFGSPEEIHRNLIQAEKSTKQNGRSAEYLKHHRSKLKGCRAR